MRERIAKRWGFWAAGPLFQRQPFVVRQDQFLQRPTGFHGGSPARGGFYPQTQLDQRLFNEFLIQDTSSFEQQAHKRGFLGEVMR